MPTKKEKEQGGVVRYRTKKLPGGKYIHIAVTKKEGPRGGKTVAGPVHKKKKTAQKKTT
jgi:hypothetical protein